jgi:hypothetical protein
MLYAGDLLYLIATSSARTAVMFLVHTLSPEYWHTLATRYCIALSMLTSVTGFFMIAFGCDIEAPWSQIVNECESIVSRMSPDAPIVCIPLNQIPTVQALDRDNRLRHCVGTGNIRHHLTHALQRAKAMDRQVQSHHGLCAPNTVYIIVLPSCATPNLHVPFQDHYHRNRQTLIPPRLALVLGPFLRPRTSNRMDTGRASIRLCDSGYSIPHALLDEAEHRSRSAFTRGLCHGDDEARVEREFRPAVIEAVAKRHYGE